MQKITLLGKCCLSREQYDKRPIYYLVLHILPRYKDLYNSKYYRNNKTSSSIHPMVFFSFGCNSVKTVPPKRLSKTNICNYSTI